MHLSTEAYHDLVLAPDAGEWFAGEDAAALVLVEGPPPTEAPGSLPSVVCWTGGSFGDAGPTPVDLIIGPDDVDELQAAVAAAPLAATALALLLRSVDRVDVDAGLVAESTTYSMLQGSPEFERWRAANPRTEIVETEPCVVTERRGGQLDIVLNRPHRHNAITAGLRDALHEALTVAVIDDSIRSVDVRGAGPSFCSGGDLDEFGRRPDPATAHRTRLARSPARLVHRLRDRITMHLHGMALGGGIELAAFAGRVVADPETIIGLPEIELGLIPGAGGTVSITRRCGRQRTAALALTGRRIDSATALAWGLVDEIAPHST